MTLQRYLITDPDYYGESPDRFQKSIEEAKDFDFILYRDKKSLNYRKFAKIFSDVLKGRGIERFLIHQDIHLAHELSAFGVHLTSTQFDKIKEAKLLNLFTIISCHSIEDIEMAVQSGVDAVTYSPIFETPNKGLPVGIVQLETVVKMFPNLRIFALGGVQSEIELNELKKVNGLFGFASIRFFI
jgi:thiamine-phosphate pyrophosphorylase